MIADDNDDDDDDDDNDIDDGGEDDFDHDADDTGGSHKVERGSELRHIFSPGPNSNQQMVRMMIVMWIVMWRVMMMVILHHLIVANVLTTRAVINSKVTIIIHKSL